MKSIGYAVAIVLLAGLTGLSGVLHGRMSNRWGPAPDTLTAANRLREIPERFGDWRMLEAEALSESVRNMLQCSGEVVRRYQNRQNGDIVSVTLLIGPPGPISVHTPEVCFGSRNFRGRGERQAVSIPAVPGENNELWRLDYQVDNLRGDQLRVYYGWSAGGRWTAAKDARFEFAGRPYLYKMQLSSLLPIGGDPAAPDPCFRFLKDFIPAAKPYLAEPSAS